MKKGYKVVRVDAGTLELMSYLNLPDTVQYKEGKATKPNEGSGPLCVFKTLEQAVQFSRDFELFACKLYDYKIYDCNYVPSKENEVWSTNPTLFRTRCLDYLPLGTALASSVTLKGKVLDV